MDNNFLKKEADELSKNHSVKYTSFSEIEGIIIRGHIILEQELNSAIEKNVPKKEFYDPDRFTFSHKLRIARMLGLVDRWITEINNLNKLRNQIAHSLSYDDKLVDSIIKSIEKEHKNADNKASKGERLKVSISYFCGHVSAYGATLGTYSKMRRHPDDLSALISDIDEAMKDDNLGNQAT